MTVNEAFEREVRRLGLTIARVEYDRYEIRATLTITGSNMFVALMLDNGTLLAAGAAQRHLIRHELHACRERLILAWHFDRVLADNPGLVLVELWRPCTEHAGNVIRSIDRGARTYRCDGAAESTVHPWPENAVIVRGGGLEVVQPEDER